MSSETMASGKSAVVLFSTRFGTTENVARALCQGLGEAGMQTTCLSTNDAPLESLKGYDLICVGGPTEAFGASNPMKEFLKSMSGVELSGKVGFAFDTRLDSTFSGGAAKYIEHALDSSGVRLAAPRTSAIVTPRKHGGKVVGADLKEGEESRFVELGRKVGALVAEEVARTGKG